MRSETTIMLAAGGTGGHLFPALALAEELAGRGMIVDLATDERSERYGTKFPARHVYHISSSPLLGRSLIGVVKTSAALSKGLAASWQLLGRVKPAAVVGFGGYPTFPPLLAARLRRIPTALHEQNAVLGRANRMLAKHVTQIATSFAETKYLVGALAGKVRLTGNPVRDAVIKASASAYAAPSESGEVRLLIFGGSQGARFFSETVPDALASLPAALKQRLDVVQQSRAEDVAGTRTAFEAAGIRACVAHFFPDLPELMARAHLIVARSGASSVAELTVIGRPSILVPLPHALDNDQLLNATRLAESGAAWCIEQQHLSADRLAREVAMLVEHPDRLAVAARAAKALARPDAVAKLADLVGDLISRA